ncbi:hypothetical protein SLV14_001682 [Streptomyces sp. Je 1-4]|uniref:hypothetical protein n=1 Tax=Streptomyces TaxID=1883 RepID=UPI0021D845C2|nr:MULTISPECIES: hypothetical protein [unclassified Streptomyces]UYB39215.1 hypothetical protein SLV14_001682 [Streptomyces sp. Je 1-4]UZQ35230.1 hypothetical protein SLV14N_001682 [Streptomyces sp. Je 1-4] [Streptomyces sp. Je 1-4 4N24]UZQ42648.1 hypothetical protein SLV14NA_001682 [Streptomyces sp. Je 1-4] [Streptomyces sp. Je 1-4 4N24_ara]
MDQPNLDFSSWSIERLETHMAGLQRGQELERIRVEAQSRVYRSVLPRVDRLRWAKLSLAANRRFHGDGPWEQARMRSQEFELRTWVIERLGADADPDWNPEALATDTLAALSLEPCQAESVTAGWRDLPKEKIGDLRRHKNLTAHINRLMPRLPPGPIKDQLARWASVRQYLP